VHRARYDRSPWYRPGPRSTMPGCGRQPPRSARAAIRSAATAHRRTGPARDDCRAPLASPAAAHDRYRAARPAVPSAPAHSRSARACARPHRRTRHTSWPAQAGPPARARTRAAARRRPAARITIESGASLGTRSLESLRGIGQIVAVQAVATRSLPCAICDLPLKCALAFELAQPFDHFQLGYGPRQLGQRLGLRDLVDLARQGVLGPLSRRDCGGLVEVPGPRCRVRQYRDFLGLNLERTAADEEQVFFALGRSNPHLTRLEQRQQWRVARRDTDLALRGRQEHHARGTGEDLPFGTNDVDLDRVHYCSVFAFSTASSIVPTM